MNRHKQEETVQHIDTMHGHLSLAAQRITDLNEQLTRLAAVETVPARVTRLEGAVDQLQMSSSSAGQQSVGLAAAAISSDSSPAPPTFDEGRISVIEQKATTFEQVAVVLNRQMERAGKAISDLERQRRLDRDLIDSLDRKLRSYDRAMAMKDVAITELTMRTQTLEWTSYDGSLTWKISDFQRRRSEAVSNKTTSLYSPAFYTSRTGKASFLM